MLHKLAIRSEQTIINLILSKKKNYFSSTQKHIMSIFLVVILDTYNRYFDYQLQIKN